VELKGLSGPIEFKEGRRIQFKLDLLKLKQHALVKVGEWSPGSGVNITDRSAFFDPGTMNVTLVVVTIPVSQMRSQVWFLSLESGLLVFSGTRDR
jgi:ionotropic kainate glutamate receptor 2